jgi:phenylalanyl-tRNA synthetase alpha chain
MNNSKLNDLLAEYRTKLLAISQLQQLRDLEIELFGKKGALQAALKAIKDVPVEERKSFGQEANAVKEQLTVLLEQRRQALLEEAERVPYSFDITRPGVAGSRGSLHPITAMQYKLDDAFRSLGFEVYEGPELSSEAYDFDCLNFVADHPARESMDTFWLAGTEDRRGGERLSLRPHLTGASVRYMQTHTPPFRFVYPGRVYRNESTDASHERAFYQYEALIVDRAVSFSAGKLLVNTILETVFGKPIKTRMRSGFFPFVEPGFEIDMECQVCGGSGCSVCGQSGWVEMMPGGPPHPNVFRAGGIDPEQWQGFYINIGLDRLVMMRHNVNDIRLFRSMDLRFFQQFA